MSGVGAALAERVGGFYSTGGEVVLAHGHVLRCTLSGSVVMDDEIRIGGVGDSVESIAASFFEASEEPDPLSSSPQELDRQAERDAARPLTRAERGYIIDPLR